MSENMQHQIAGRLRAIMDELGKTRAQFAEFLEVGEGRLGNWIGTTAKSNKPSEETMALLCAKFPKMTMDYIYLGRMDGLPMDLAIRLKARELGLDPNAEDFQQEPLMASVLKASQRV